MKKTIKISSVVLVIIAILISIGVVIIFCGDALSAYEKQENIDTVYSIGERMLFTNLIVSILCFILVTVSFIFKLKSKDCSKLKSIVKYVVSIVFIGLLILISGFFYNRNQATFAFQSEVSKREFVYPDVKLVGYNPLNADCKFKIIGVASEDIFDGEVQISSDNFEFSAFNKGEIYVMKRSKQYDYKYKWYYDNSPYFADSSHLYTAG